MVKPTIPPGTRIHLFKKVQHLLDWRLLRKPVEGMFHLWEKYIRTCRKRSARSSRSSLAMAPAPGAMVRMLGRNASTISREIKRNTWFPSNESESYQPYWPKRLRTRPWTGCYYIAGPAQRKAYRRRFKLRKPCRLSRGHRRLRKRMGRKALRFPIPGRASISRRPPEVGDRSAFSHWETDSVIGAGCNLHTEVERRIRFFMARIVPDKNAWESVGA